MFGSSICNALSGKCICKVNVEGARCDKCKDGFFGISGSDLAGCSHCDCSVKGTVAGNNVCDKTTGQCLCKEGFTGRQCSTCKEGYFGYPPSAPTECKECDCYPSGSTNMTCDQSGQCFCRKRYFDRGCSSIQIGYFSASVWQLWFSSISATVLSPVSFFLKHTVIVKLYYIISWRVVVVCFFKLIICCWAFKREEINMAKQGKNIHIDQFINIP